MNPQQIIERRVIFKAAEILTSAEAAASARDYDGSDRRIGSSRERSLELVGHGHVEGVQPIGTVKRQRKDSVCTGDLNERHARTLVEAASVDDPHA